MKLIRLGWVLLTILLTLAAYGFGPGRQASASAQTRTKWEYQIVKADRVDRSPAGALQVKGLSQLGDDGWEAVGMNESWVLLKRSR